ncbi:hypothetical protein DFH07DRAFT_1064970 [Mycena maculata]|uniref:Uncharacterized protein n=1 Tax=Mycena maculata TaxID=230809 RepID=A0AAD7I5X2_9AGAR|nr:hypothetical protein DFH07DRAFT_1064970 [Mycena maculata]
MISTSEWTTKDDAYNYECMFKSVVKLLEKQMDTWVIDTLAFYQRHVFESLDRSADESSNDDDDDSNALAILALQAARDSPPVTRPPNHTHFIGLPQYFLGCIDHCISSRFAVLSRPPTVLKEFSAVCLLKSRMMRYVSLIPSTPACHLFLVFFSECASASLPGIKMGTWEHS